MTSMQVFLQTSMLVILITLPVVFAVLTFAISASFFRFMSSATFALGAWYLLSQAATGGNFYQWLGILYIGLAVMMPFAKIATTNKNEDTMDKKEDITSLDRYAEKLAKNDAKYAKLRGLGRRKIIRRNPYEEE